MVQSLMQVDVALQTFFSVAASLGASGLEFGVVVGGGVGVFMAWV
jgi:hypothetical protein